MKTVLITGANRGIGLEFTKQLLEKGERVYACCRRPNSAVALKELAARHINSMRTVELDVQRDADIQQVAQQIQHEHSALDMLINNAGVMPDHRSLDQIPRNELQHTLDVNTVSPLMMVQSCLKILASAPSPIVLNISSQRGAFGLRQPTNRYAYCTSKAALNMVTKILAEDLQEIGGIVLAIHPGWVQTDMGGPNGDLTPEVSVREMLAFLDTVTPAHNGGFYRWDGKEHVW
ncbi:MAG: SDR family oxidoreductase [Calditrichota bacterium]